MCAGFGNTANIFCGYFEDKSQVWCGQRANVNGTEVFGGSCEDPPSYVSWDGVHYTDAANHLIAAQIINGSYSDPPVPIKRSCHRIQA